MQGGLSERAMLVALHVGTWSGMMTDREVSDDVQARYDAQEGAGRYNKRLVAQSFLKDINQAASRARTVHRTLTLPWGDSGERIITTKSYQTYTQQMHTARVAFDSAAMKFVKEWPNQTILSEAKARLGKMYIAEDYPSAEDLAKRFSLDVEVNKVPESADFRANLADSSVKAIVKDIERRTNERVERAMKDAYSRVAEVVQKMMEGLRAYEPAQGDEGPKKNFRDSLVYNVNEVAELLPLINITGDAKLDALHTQLVKELVEHSPEVLKKDKGKRDATADRAEKILAKVKRFMA